MKISVIRYAKSVSTPEPSTTTLQNVYFDDLLKPGFLLSVDPGVEGGFAIFQTPSGKLQRAGIWQPNGKLDWGARTDEAITQLESEFLWCGPLAMKGCVCEWPTYFDSAGGRATAISDKLGKLMFFVGRVAQLAYSRGVNFYPVPVRDWKGQMPKTAVESRIRRRLSSRPTEIQTVQQAGSHAWDAVGIGLFCLGRF